jgi:hypothetical protein
MKMYPVGNFSLKKYPRGYVRPYAVSPLDYPTGSSGAAGTVSRGSTSARAARTYRSPPATTRYYGGVWKTFDHWVTIGRGVMRLRERADQLKGRKTFQRLMEQHASASCAPRRRRRSPRGLNASCSRRTSTGSAPASPSSVPRHCPVFASDKPAKPAGPAMTKPTNGDLARELVAPRRAHRGAGGRTAGPHRAAGV